MRPKSQKKIRTRTDDSNVQQEMGLPNDVAALHFVCRCFGIGEKELQRTLERVRKFTKSPDQDFPSKFHRMLLVRSRAGDKQWDQALRVIQREALYDHVCRENGKPSFSFAGEIADKLLRSLTLLYERLLPKLDVDGVSRPVAMWILVENVFVPTAYAQLVKDWQRGLGSEFRGETCWYLPLRTRDESLKPIPRILDHWLRAAGFRTAYGVSKEIGTDRSAVDEWRRGEKVPTLRTLHRLVEKFVSEVSWLDEPDGWKGRFTLACAMQNLCDRMNSYFNDIQRDSSFSVAEMFGKIADDHIVTDEGGLLAGTHSFFATRLLQRRLQQEKKWKKNVIEFMPTSSSGQQTSAWEFHIGNRFLEFIKAEGRENQQFRKTAKTIGENIALGEYLIDLGALELNRLYQVAREGTGEREPPRRP